MQNGPCTLPDFADPAVAVEYAAQIWIVADPLRMNIILAIGHDEVVTSQLMDVLDADPHTIAEELNALVAVRIIDAKMLHGRLHYALRPGLLRIEDGKTIIQLASIRITIPNG